MKNVLRSSLFIVFFFLLQAIGAQQVSIIAKSALFEELAEGSLKVLSLKNGYTVVVYFTPKSNINFRVYDDTHHTKYNKTVVPKVGYDIRTLSLHGVLETNGNVTVLYSTYDKDKTPLLCRIIFNAETGVVVSEETIGRLDKISVKTAYAMAYGDVPIPTFYVRKDPYSENYAVVLYNTMASDGNKRIEVIHYNSQNQEISKAYNPSPNDGYKYIKFLDMVVVGNKEVIVASIGYNTKASGGNQIGAILLGSMKASSHNIDLTKIKYAKASAIESGALKYNQQTGDLYFFTMENLGTEKNVTTYSMLLNIIAGDLTAVKKSIPMTAKKLQEIAQREFNKNTDIFAVPQNIYPNPDGSFSILFEERTVSYGFAAGLVAGDIGIIRYDKSGSEVGATYVPKASSGGTSLMYNYKNQLSGTKLEFEAQYKDFSYINTGEKEYVLFNDEPENQDKIDNKKPVAVILDSKASEAFFFDFRNSNNIPERKSIFERNGKEKTVGIFGGADYNEATKTLTLVVNTHHQKGPSSKIVWLKLD